MKPLHRAKAGARPARLRRLKACGGLLGVFAALSTARAEEPREPTLLPAVQRVDAGVTREGVDGGVGAPALTLEALQREVEALRRRDAEKQARLDELAHQLHDLRPPTREEGGTVEPPQHEHGETHLPVIRFGANLDLLASLEAVAGPPPAGDDGRPRARLFLREAEVAAEARVTTWLYGALFLTRPDGEPFTIEEAYAVADLPFELRLKAGYYRAEFGLLNTVHEPERPQATLPLPIVEFFGDEQLREPALTLGRAFGLGNSQGLGLSAAVLNNENQVAFDGGKTSAKAFAGKLYYGLERSGFHSRLGLSALTGVNASGGRSVIGAVDFGLYFAPGYNAGYDYPARVSWLGEVLWNRRETAGALGSVNDAVGFWTVADWQFIRAHHLGVGIEYVQGRDDSRQSSQAYSVHYSWYFEGHSRLQLQGRYLDAPTQGSRGWQVLLQWNVVLGPHSERPLLALVPSAQGG